MARACSGPQADEEVLARDGVADGHGEVGDDAVGVVRMEGEQLAVGVGDIASGEYKRHARLPYGGHIDVLPENNSGSGWLAPCPVFEFE